MKCISHPDRQAKTFCVTCKRPICEDCAIEVDDGTSLCMKCTVTSTLRQMSDRRQEKAKTKESRKTEAKAKKKKRSFVRLLVVGSIGLVLAVAELLFYYRVSKVEVAQFVPSKSPTTFAVMIDQAIRGYSRDHGGVVPNGLQDLIGKYLPKDKIKPGDLEDFIYVRKTETSYEFRPKRMESDLMPTLIFTEESVELGDLP